MYRRLNSVLGMLAGLLVSSVSLLAVPDSKPVSWPVTSGSPADTLASQEALSSADFLLSVDSLSSVDTLPLQAFPLEGMVRTDTVPGGTDALADVSPWPSLVADTTGLALSDSLLHDFSAQDLAVAMNTDDMRRLLEDWAFQGCYERMELLIMAGRYADALAVSDSTLELSETPANYYYQGLVNECMGAWRRAEWAYSKAIKLNPARLDSYLPLVRVLLNLNAPEEAMVWCDRYFDNGGDQLEGLLFRSRAFAMLNEYKEAAADISQVIAMDSNNMNAYRLRAVYYMQDFRFDKAVEDWTWLLSQKEHPEWMALRADCYEQLGQYAQALDDVRRVVALTKDNQNFSGLYQVAQVQVRELESRFSDMETTKTEYVADILPAVSDSVELRVEAVPAQTDEILLPKNLVNDK